MVNVFVIDVVIVIFKGVSTVSKGCDRTVPDSSKDTIDEYIWATNICLINYLSSKDMIVDYIWARKIWLINSSKLKRYVASELLSEGKVKQIFVLPLHLPTYSIN